MSSFYFTYYKVCILLFIYFLLLNIKGKFSSSTNSVNSKMDFIIMSKRTKTSIFQNFKASFLGLLAIDFD
jgi:hypothetical protein